MGIKINICLLIFIAIIYSILDTSQIELLLDDGPFPILETIMDAKKILPALE